MAMSWLMVNTYWLRSSDVRDKVYALYSMVPDAYKLPKPKYDAPVDDILWSVVVRVIETERSLRIYDCGGMPASVSVSSDGLELVVGGFELDQITSVADIPSENEPSQCLAYASGVMDGRFVSELASDGDARTAAF